VAKSTKSTEPTKVNNRSYADVIAAQPSRTDFSKLTDRVSSNITWASKLMEGRQLDRGLALKRADVDNNTSVVLKEEDVFSTKDVWGFSHVGRFAGRFPGTKAVSILCYSWKLPCKIFCHKNGWLVFQSSIDKDMDCVLHGGPYFLYGKLLLLQPMSTFFTFAEDQLTCTPISVQLSNLLWKCWCEVALNRILSMVDTPLATDSLTVKFARISYGRALVDVDLSQHLCREVPVTLPNGSTLNIFLAFVIFATLLDALEIGVRWLPRIIRWRTSLV
jgi:hypothetical protein